MNKIKKVALQAAMARINEELKTGLVPMAKSILTFQFNTFDSVDDVQEHIRMEEAPIVIAAYAKLMKEKGLFVALHLQDISFKFDGYQVDVFLILSNKQPHRCSEENVPYAYNYFRYHESGTVSFPTSNPNSDTVGEDWSEVLLTPIF